MSAPEINDIDTSRYNFHMPEEGNIRVHDGLTEDVVREISRRKDEPEWMLEHRLACLKTYRELDPPSNWGPSLDGLDLDHMSAYVTPPDAEHTSTWDEVPEDVRDTFERLGIPEAERQYLAGVAAQYDSEMVYHNMQENAAKLGIVYTGIEQALHSEYADMVKDHFMKLIPARDHKFAALHGAVWSGGSFIYVPKGVKVEYPLQSYYRMNAKNSGQFEHTIIIVEDDADLEFIEGCSAPHYNEANLHDGCVEVYVGKRAHLRYSVIENWSKNMYNLSSKRVRVDEDGRLETVQGAFGSHVSCVYPSALLVGDRASYDYTGITFSGAGQNLDTGCKVVMTGKDTKVTINAKSLSKDGGHGTFRSSVVVGRHADRATCTVSCDSLILDNESVSDTIPAMDVRCPTASVGHEATIGRISDDTIAYLMSRGNTEAEARTLVVNGFANPISKELPLEYAVEMNNLIKLEMEGAIG